MLYKKLARHNLTLVSSVPNLSGASQFIYDEAGQLVKEIVGSANYEYAYDSKGNISSRETYSNGTLTKTDTFTYGADSWEDRLTGYNNKTITYDQIGNPTSYLGATLSWRGRELVGYEKGNKQISYSYDVDGMRYRKTVKTNGTETARYDYVYSDGKLILLTYTANGTSNTARFIYDSWGEPRGFILNNTASYIYLKNAQGDISAIVDENGEVLLTYTYTAWGKVTYSATSMESLALAATLSNVNPFTYRGYCYDYDIGMYYLQSRYYDPEISRFINADDTNYLNATGTVLSYNLFAYCENDGVNFVDKNGTSKVETLNKIANNYYKTNEKLSVTFAKLLIANGKNYYLAFHELAQVVIGDKLYSSGYNVKLEYYCGNGEIDVVASKYIRRNTIRYYMWEVKPLGTSATKQLKQYKQAKPTFCLGFNPGTITRKICKDLKIKIKFNNNGAAYYRFYNDKGKEISNKTLADAIKSGIYKALAVGIAALTITAIATVLIIYLSGGSAAVPAAKVAATTASSVSTTTLAAIILLAAEAISKAA